MPTLRKSLGLESSRRQKQRSAHIETIEKTTDVSQLLALLSYHRAAENVEETEAIQKALTIANAQAWREARSHTLQDDEEEARLDAEAFKTAKAIRKLLLQK